MICRRCVECIEGQEHHWIENFDFSEGGDPEYACKHCDSYCHARDDEDGFSEADGVVVQWTPPVSAAELLAEIERMRPVYLAAIEWRRNDTGAEALRTCRALIDAVDAAEADCG